jgi:hypothetical protein
MGLQIVSIHVSFATMSAVFTSVVMPEKTEELINPFCFHASLHFVNIKCSHTGQVDVSSLFFAFVSPFCFYFHRPRLGRGVSELTEARTVWQTIQLFLRMGLL